MLNAEAVRLDQIIESRSRKEKVVGGEYIAFNGALMMAVYAFNYFIHSSWWSWLIGMGIGWAGFIIYSSLKERREGSYSTRIQSEVFAVWIVLAGVALPLAIVVFPGIFHLYCGRAIFAIAYLITGIGVLLTGIIAQSLEFKLGAVAFGAAVFLSIFFNTNIQQFEIFYFAMSAGMVIPGIVSKYNERKG